MELAIHTYVNRDGKLIVKAGISYNGGSCYISCAATKDVYELYYIMLEEVEEKERQGYD